jgi:hypothetical protein
MLGRGGVHLTVGGVLKIEAGADTGARASIDSLLPRSIRLEFPTTAPMGFSVNGVEGSVTQGASGFFAAGLPAVLQEDLKVTYGSVTDPEFNSGFAPGGPHPPSLEDVTPHVVRIDPAPTAALEMARSVLLEQPLTGMNQPLTGMNQLAPMLFLNEPLGGMNRQRRPGEEL